MEWHACLDEYEKLVVRMSTPRVVIDNAVCPTATLVKVDSARRHGILLDAVQVLTDLNLSIKKAYISSDGQWFMDVFHVTDLNGNKLTDESVISYIEQSLENTHPDTSHGFNGLKALELTGTDRIGLLSEVFAVLADLQCAVVDAKVWTHNGRIASLIFVKDCNSGSPIEDSQQIDKIEARLRNVLKGNNDIRSARTSISMAVTHTERRLHQMMFDDRDYERKPILQHKSDLPVVTVQNWVERAYSVVNVQCKDRTKLLFDVVCTLTDMQYVVFHATIKTSGDKAYMEFYVRHIDGTPISSEPERHRLIQCLQAAVERRASEGVRLELHTSDKQGLLADVTRTFRENGLNLTRAEISTTSDMALNVFYVTDAAGNIADPKIIESVRKKIGLANLKVKELPLIYYEKAESEAQAVGVGGAVLLSLGSLVRRNLYNLGLIKSYLEWKLQERFDSLVGKWHVL
ncbi:ACT domain-containing protein ACR5 [Hibiscus syriacus]|uniref:ACT domain-containing protein ACR n=1 Tax=Hibiscus syriacus TaxID=106335 RepID=A0A6A3C5Y2_HIBSY|nr:ACT domain-containing protein ACR8-like [Hibiscus syriacus]KAE8724645.1 ACT domain-containing protein ACR5 [Hibiscus syriacus]